MKETTEFKFSFYKDVCLDISKFTNNISKNEINLIRNYRKYKPFKIVECDKNIGMCIVSHEIYNELATSHLSSSTYEAIAFNPLSESIDNIYTVLSELFSRKHISKRLFNRLLVKDAKLGRFRILFKLHKAKFGIRPIINSISHPSSNICLLIDLILQPFVKDTPSFILDSQNLIQKTQNISFPLDSKLYSCDFESLYTNINLSHALEVICDFMKSNLDIRELDISAFYALLKLVFDNNFFEFNNDYYRQKIGIQWLHLVDNR